MGFHLNAVSPWGLLPLLLGLCLLLAAPRLPQKALWPARLTALGLAFLGAILCFALP